MVKKGFANHVVMKTLCPILWSKNSSATVTLLNSVCFTTPCYRQFYNLWFSNEADIVCLSYTYDRSHYERSATNKAHCFLHTNFLLPDADVATGIVRRLRTFRCVSFAGTIFRRCYCRFFRICCKFKILIM